MYMISEYITLNHWKDRKKKQPHIKIKQNLNPRQRAPQYLWFRRCYRQEHPLQASPQNLLQCATKTSSLFKVRLDLSHKMFKEHVWTILNILNPLVIWVAKTGESRPTNGMYAKWTLLLNCYQWIDLRDMFRKKKPYSIGLKPIHW